MRITVILCTYNRCESLRKTLESTAALVLPNRHSCEVLVIDNNSRDRTSEVIEDFCTRYPGRFRSVFEAQQGKSNALNRGIRESNADILAFLDDDVIAERDWLEKLIEPFDNPCWIGVGGRIVPPKDFAPPAWLVLNGPYAMGGVLALFDKGSAGAELMEPPFGTNMAFRRDVFEKYGSFRTDIGPCPGSEIRGEDIEFGLRVLEGGGRLWYEPSAIVHHAVPENRLRKAYFLRFLFDHGRSSIRQKDWRVPVGFIPRPYLTIPKIALSELSRRTVAWLISIDPPRRFQRKCMVWASLGKLSELFSLLSAENKSRAGFQGTAKNKENRA